MDTAFGRGASFCPSSRSRSESEGVLQDEAPTASTFDNPYGDVQESACLGLQTRPDFGGPGWRRRWWSIYLHLQLLGVSASTARASTDPSPPEVEEVSFPGNRSQRSLRYLRGLLRVLLKGMKIDLEALGFYFVLCRQLCVACIYRGLHFLCRTSINIRALAVF